MADEAVRVILRYEGENISVESQQRIEMLVQASDDLKGFERQVGFSLELRDANEQLLYRHVLHDPFQPNVEALTAQGEKEGLARVPVETRAGHLVLLTPHLEAADHLALVRAVPEEEAKDARRVEVFRLVLGRPQIEGTEMRTDGSR